MEAEILRAANLLAAVMRQDLEHTLDRCTGRELLLMARMHDMAEPAPAEDDGPPMPTQEQLNAFIAATGGDPAPEV